MLGRYEKVKKKKNSKKEKAGLRFWHFKLKIENMRTEPLPPCRPRCSAAANGLFRALIWGLSTWFSGINGKKSDPVCARLVQHRRRRTGFPSSIFFDDHYTVKSIVCPPPPLIYPCMHFSEGRLDDDALACFVSETHFSVGIVELSMVLYPLGNPEGCRMANITCFDAMSRLTRSLE